MKSTFRRKMKHLAIILVFFFLPGSIFSQGNKMALVIGNSNYQTGAQLPNPENDAKDIAEKLEQAGFDVLLRIDLDQTGMKKVIDEFGEKLVQAEVGLFFYAGHGVQNKGRNYLIPVDAKLKTENDIEYNCVDAGRILAKMEDANTKTNIVILDACRNNPFERSWSRNSNGNGLAFINAPSGSLIAYSTSPGKTASDGYYRNSPYTEGLLEFINTPNLKIEDLFKLVRVWVINKTGGQQEPWESTSLRGDFFFNADKENSQASLSALLPHITEQANLTTSINTSDYESQRQQLASKIRSIAVMPFSNYTGDEGKAYMASGLQDALISELGQLGTLRVISKTSTHQYANMEKTINEISQELNVDGVLETSLISLGEIIRMQLKLYCAHPVEQMVWSKEYDSDMSDILNLYNRVISNIADEIQLSLTPELELELGLGRQRIDPEAYDAYLEGQYYWEKLDQESMQKALEYFQQATEIEPEWADPYAGLANAWSMFGTIFRTLPKSVTLPKTYEYLNKALDLDQNSAQAHYVKALTAVWAEFDWEQGEKEFLKSLELNPNDALCRIYYSHLLSILRRYDEAETQANLALQLDPFKPLVLYLHGMIMSFNGDYKTANQDWEKAISIDPNFSMPAGSIIVYHMNNAFESGNYEKWIELWADKVGPNGHWKEEGIEAVLNAFHEGGHIASIKEMFRMNAKYGNECFMTSGLKAKRYIVLQEYDKAIDCLEKDFEIRDMAITYITTNAFVDNQLKDKPRYIELLKKLNLPLND